MVSPFIAFTLKRKLFLSVVNIFLPQLYLYIIINWFLNNTCEIRILGALLRSSISLFLIVMGIVILFDLHSLNLTNIYIVAFPLKLDFCVCLPVQHCFTRKVHRLENSINRELTFLISLIFHISKITIYSQMRNENVCSELTFQDRHTAWRFMLYFTFFFSLL